LRSAHTAGSPASGFTADGGFGSSARGSSSLVEIRGDPAVLEAYLGGAANVGG